MTYACPTWGVRGRHPSFEIAVPAKQGSLYQSAKCMRISKCHMYVTLLENYASRNLKSYKITKMYL